MTTFNFERLNCWKYARTLVKNIYRVTGQFPESEKFGLVNQLRRAAVSVSSNVAEEPVDKHQKTKNIFTLWPMAHCAK
ncbi:MAG: four helix bundle protein [Muribaculaceae bacterium]|nr:four helix bundle protein [Muribaculaceae bacterium]MDE6262592.1 four helix bundle protein [Muribaculaceae bacterium]